MKPLRGLAAGLALAAISAGLTAISVSAAKPDRQPAPTPSDITTDVCGPVIGPVLGKITVNREFITTFTSPDGTVRLAVNGASFATFTRLSNGNSVAINASGPSAITIHPDGTVILVTRGLLAAIEPDGIWQFAGRVDVDPTTGAILDFSGRKTSICDMLA